MRTTVMLFLSLVVSVNAFACRCLPMTWEEETISSERIFHGKVIAENDNRFDIEVMKIWKGEFTSTVFQLVQGTTSCNTKTFELTKEYLFYVRGSEVRNCSRTTEFDLTIDTEWLNAKFKGIGNMSLIEAEELTVLQRDVLIRLFQKSGNVWPNDLEGMSIRFAVKEEFVTKLVFFQVVLSSSNLFKMEKVNNGKTDFYILWVGYDW